MARYGIYRIVINGAVKKRNIILLNRNENITDLEIQAAKDLKLKVVKALVCIKSLDAKDAELCDVIHQNPRDLTNPVSEKQGKQNAHDISHNAQPRKVEPTK